MNYNNRALFLDRDGVINYDYGYVHNKDRFRFISGIFELCYYLQQKGYLIIIITNQAGIGKGLYSMKEFEILNDWMIEKFRMKKIKINKTYYCPHTDSDNCNCRKPKTGMILNAKNDFMIDLSRSILIGDKKTDILAGEKAGISTNIYFNSNNHDATIKHIKKLNLENNLLEKL